VPSTPALVSNATMLATPADGFAGSLGQSSGTRLVENLYYQAFNLAANNIYLRDYNEQCPEHISSLVNYIGRGRYYPGLSLDQVRQDMALYKLGSESTESEVGDCFKASILPGFDSRDGLRRIGRYPMDKDVVPNTTSDLKVSGPVPDVLYGYYRRAFPQQQV
jgi:hypothetical protein